MDQKKSNRRVCLLTALVFFCTSAGPLPQAGASEPASIPFTGGVRSLSLPGHAGTIQTVFEGSSPQTVIIVQDAHAIPEAQQSIRKIIGHFEETNGLSLIGLEGAASRLDTRFLKNFPDREALEELFEDYSAKGELPGPVAAAVLGKGGSEYHGIEDWALYENGLSLYIASLDGEEAALKRISEYKTRLEKEKAAVFSPQLLEADGLIREFYEERLNLADFLIRLSVYREPGKGSGLALMLDRLRRGGAIGSVETEVKEIAREVEQRLRDAEKTPELQAESAVFYQKLQEFNTSTLSPESFALYLRELSGRFDLEVNASADLALLMSEQRTIDEIEGTSFFDELEAFISSVKDGLIHTGAERKLDREAAALRLMHKAARMELSRKEWLELKGRLHEISSAYPEVDLAGRVRFYENAERRDGAFLDRLTGLMKDKGKTLALMVAGGFHAQGLSERLKEKSISHVLIVPEIEALPEENRYREHMRGEVSWKKYFTAENGRVNLYQAFIRAARDELLARSSERPGIILKNWRDAIIRSLAAEGKTDEAAKYTFFIDEVMDGEEKREEDRLRKVDEFIGGIRRLEKTGQITPENILRLIGPSGITAGAAGAGVQAPEDYLSAPLASADFRSEMRNAEARMPVDAEAINAAVEEEITAIRGKHLRAIEELKERAAPLLAEKAAGNRTFQAEYSRIIEETILAVINVFDAEFGLRDKVAVFVLGSLARRTSPYGTDIDVFFAANESGKQAWKVIEVLTTSLKSTITEGVDTPVEPNDLKSPVYFPTVEALENDFARMDGISLYSLLDRKFIFGDEKIYAAMNSLLTKDFYGRYLEDWMIVESRTDAALDDPYLSEEINEALDLFSLRRAVKSLADLRKRIYRKTGLKLSARQLKSLQQGRVSPESFAERQNHLFNYLRSQVEAPLSHRSSATPVSEDLVRGFEPKTGPGGLRTIQVLGYIGRIQHRNNDEVSAWNWGEGSTTDLFRLLADVSEEEFINEEETQKLGNAERFFIRLRSAMNLAAQRAGLTEALDVYTLELEEEVAALMGMTPAGLRERLVFHREAVLRIAGSVDFEQRSELRSGEEADSAGTPDAESYGVLHIVMTALEMSMTGNKIRIAVKRGPAPEAVYNFEGTEEITIGRGDHQKVRLRDAYVSREHLAVRFNPERREWEFRDVGSANGVDVYGKHFGGDGKNKRSSGWMSFDEMEAFRSALAEAPVNDLRSTLYHGLRAYPETPPAAYAQGKVLELLSGFSGIEKRWTAKRSFLELVKQTAFDKDRQAQKALLFFMPGVGDRYINTATGTIRTITEIVDMLAEVRIQPLAAQSRPITVPVQRLLTELEGYKKLGLYETPVLKRQNEYLWRNAGPGERVQAVIDILLEHPLGIPKIYEEVEAFDPSGPPRQRMAHQIFKSLYELFRLNEAPDALPAVRKALEETEEYRAFVRQSEESVPPAIPVPSPSEQLARKIAELERNPDILAVIDMAALNIRDLTGIDEDVLRRADRLSISLDQGMRSLSADDLNESDPAVAEKANFIRVLRSKTGPELSRREINRALGPRHEELRAEIQRLVSVFGEAALYGILFVRDGEARVRVPFDSDKDSEEEQRALRRRAETEVRRLTGIIRGQPLTAADISKLNAMIGVARAELRAEEDEDREEFPAERYNRILTEAEKALDSIEAFMAEADWFDFERDLEAGIMVFYGERDELLNALGEEFLSGIYESRYEALIERIHLIEKEIAKHAPVREPVLRQRTETESEPRLDLLGALFGSEMEQIEEEIEQSQFAWLGSRDITSMLQAMSRLEQLEGAVEEALEEWNAVNMETAERVLTRISINRQELNAMFNEIRSEARSEFREPKMTHLTTLSAAKTIIEEGFYNGIDYKTFLPYAPAGISYPTYGDDTKVEIVFNDAGELVEGERGPMGDIAAYKLTQKSRVPAERGEEIKKIVGYKEYDGMLKTGKGNIGHLPAEYVNFSKTIERNKRRMERLEVLDPAAYGQLIDFILAHLDKTGASENVREAVRAAIDGPAARSDLRELEISLTEQIEQAVAGGTDRNEAMSSARSEYLKRLNEIAGELRGIESGFAEAKSAGEYPAELLSAADEFFSQIKDRAIPAAEESALIEKEDKENFFAELLAGIKRIQTGYSEVYDKILSARGFRIRLEATAAAPLMINVIQEDGEEGEPVKKPLVFTKETKELPVEGVQETLMALQTEWLTSDQPSELDFPVIFRITYILGEFVSNRTDHEFSKMDNALGQVRALILPDRAIFVIRDNAPYFPIEEKIYEYVSPLAEGESRKSLDDKIVGAQDERAKEGKRAGGLGTMILKDLVNMPGEEQKGASITQIKRSPGDTGNELTFEFDYAKVKEWLEIEGKRRSIEDALQKFDEYFTDESMKEIRDAEWAAPLTETIKDHRDRLAADRDNEEVFSRAQKVLAALALIGRIQSLLAKPKYEESERRALLSLRDKAAADPLSDESAGGDAFVSKLTTHHTQISRALGSMKTPVLYDENDKILPRVKTKFEDETFVRFMDMNPFVLDGMRFSEVVTDAGVKSPGEIVPIIEAYFPDGKDTLFVDAYPAGTDMTAAVLPQPLGISALHHTDPANPKIRELSEKTGRKLLTAGAAAKLPEKESRSELRNGLEADTPAERAENEVKEMAETIFGALTNGTRGTAEETLARAAEKLASEENLRGALLTQLEALKTEALQDEDFFAYLEAKGISRQIYTEQVELEINFLMEKISSMPQSENAVGFVASPENVSNETFMLSFIEALKEKGVRYVVVTGESAVSAAERLRRQDFKVILPQERNKEILLPSLQRYTGMLTQSSVEGNPGLPFDNAVYVGRSISGEELDPVTARYITALQTAVSLLIASEATDAVKLKEMLGNPAALLQKLYPEFASPMIEGGANGLQISTAAIQAYLEWRASEAIQASA